MSTARRFWLIFCLYRVNLVQCHQFKTLNMGMTMINPKNSKKYKMISCVLACILFTTGFNKINAATSETPINITADNIRYHLSKNNSTITGDVIIEYDTTKIQGRALRLYFDENHQLDHFTVLGDPAKYQSKPRSEQPMLYAKAKLVRVNLKTSEIEMIQESEVEQGEDFFRGPYMLYNHKNHTITIAKGAHQTLTIPLK